MTIDKAYLEGKLTGYRQQLEGLAAQAGVIQGAIATTKAFLKDLETDEALVEAVKADDDGEWNWDND